MRRHLNGLGYLLAAKLVRCGKGLHDVIILVSGGVAFVAYESYSFTACRSDKVRNMSPAKKSVQPLFRFLIVVVEAANRRS